MKDRCAGCGKELAGFKCCSRAYWSKQAPLIADSRTRYQLTGISVPTRNKWFLYGDFIDTPKWYPDEDNL